MYASAITAQVDPKRIDELSGVFTRHGATLREATGCTGVFVLGERRAGQVRILSMWETEDDAKAVATSPVWQALVADLRGLLLDQPKRAMLEVLYQV